MKGKCLKSVVPILLGLCLISPSVCHAGLLGDVAGKLLERYENYQTRKLEEAQTKELYDQVKILAVDILKLAEQGDSESQKNVSTYFERGVLGFNRDLNKAFYWAKKAAEQGDSVSMERVALYYHMGIGVEKNFEKAVMWYVAGAEHNNESCKIAAGDCYFNGWGCKRDDKLAVSYYSDVYNNTNDRMLKVAANLRLGICYMYGRGCQKNEEQAFAMFSEIFDTSNSIDNKFYIVEGGIGEKIKRELFGWEKIGNQALPMLAELIYSLQYPHLRNYYIVTETKVNPSPEEWFLNQDLLLCKFNTYLNYIYLAKCYYEGIGCIADTKKAMKILKKAKKFYDEKTWSNLYVVPSFPHDTLIYHNVGNYIKKIMPSK